MKNLQISDPAVGEVLLECGYPKDAVKYFTLRLALKAACGAVFVALLALFMALIAGQYMMFYTILPLYLAMAVFIVYWNKVVTERNSVLFTESGTGLLSLKDKSTVSGFSLYGEYKYYEIKKPKNKNFYIIYVKAAAKINCGAFESLEALSKAELVLEGRVLKKVKKAS